MKFLFSAESIYLKQSLALIRIFVGLMVVYHGIEVFDSKTMEGYLGWDTFKFPNSEALVYLGKATELVAGILITFGFLTRLGTVLLIGVMLFITFYIGQGRFWYEEQHSFLFAVIGLIYFFYGSGIWSLDALRNKSK